MALAEVVAVAVAASSAVAAFEVAPTNFQVALRLSCVCVCCSKRRVQTPLLRVRAPLMVRHVRVLVRHEPLLVRHVILLLHVHLHSQRCLQAVVHHVHLMRLDVLRHRPPAHEQQH